MKKITKIIIGISILFLVLGSAAAFEIKDLKTIDEYNAFDNNGESHYRTNDQRYFVVEKIANFDDDFKNEWFTNNTKLKTTAIPMGDNIFYFEDLNFNIYCYQEVVQLDGDYYMVSIDQKSKLSPSEKTGYLNDLKEFNKLNDLKPIEI